MKKNKLSLNEFVWYGLNYSTNLLKIATISYILNHETSSKSGGLNGGYLFFLVLLINTGFAMIISKAFGWSTKTHHQGSGGYFNVLTAWYGQKTGFFFLIFHYLFYPVVIAYLITGLSRVEFYDLVKEHWGTSSYLYLDLIGLGIYWGLMFLMFTSAKYLKKIINRITGFNFLMIIFLIGYIFYQVIFQSSNIVYWKIKYSPTNFQNFIKIFTIVFGYFLGFSAFTTLTEGVQNAPRNIGRGTGIILFLIGLFIAVVALLMIMTCNNSEGILHIPKNPANLISHHQTNFWWILITLSLSMSTAIQIIMHNYYTIHGELYPAGYYEFIPLKFSKQPQKNINRPSLKLNLLIGTLAGVFFLIIPDLILQQKKINNTQNPFNIAIFLEIISILVMVVYFIVVVTMIRLKIKYRFAPISWIMVSIWVVSLMFLLIAITAFWYELIEKLLTQELLSLIYSGSLIIYFLFLITAPPFWYKFYYKKQKPKHTLEKNNVKVIPYTTFEKYQLVFQQQNVYAAEKMMSQLEIIVDSYPAKKD